MAFDISKLNNREKNIIGLLIIILSCIPAFQFVLPMWTEYKASSENIKADKDKAVSLDLQIKRLGKLKEKNIELEEKIDTQKLFLAKNYELDFLVQDLKKLCDESSISLESFTPTAPQPVNIVLEKQVDVNSAEKIKDRKRTKNQKLKQVFNKIQGDELPVDVYSFPIEVRVTGNFRDIVSLFQKLEKYGRVISVDNISIGKMQSKRGSDRLSVKPKKNEENTGRLFTDFDLIAYSLPHEGETLSIKDIRTSNTSTSKTSRKRR